jgi:hypothetical protein
MFKIQAHDSISLPALYQAYAYDARQDGIALTKCCSPDPRRLSPCTSQRTGWESTNLNQRTPTIAKSPYKRRSVPHQLEQKPRHPLLLK